MPSILANVDLRLLNTLGLPSVAERFATVSSIDDLPRLLEADRNSPIHILGGGSNLWLPERVSGLTLQIDIKGKSLIREDADFWYVSAAAGENWHDFVMWTLNQGWSGLENLALIPGTVGAAPIQNIGAYGVEIKDRFESLRAVHLLDGEVRQFDAKSCQFAYRDSVFKRDEAGKWMIIETTFKLPKDWQPCLGYGDMAKSLTDEAITPVAVANAVMKTRKAKLPDPVVIGNAGSFFHNPVVSQQKAASLKVRFPNLVAYPVGDAGVKLAAGWLIDQCGWKGKAMGPVGMYDKQALVLVNHGGASNADVERLCAAVQDDVFEKFAVRLTPEPIRW